MTEKPLIIAIGGTLRPGSNTERALATCLKGAERAGARTVLLKGSDLMLPLYNPGDEKRTKEARALVDLIRRCDGLIVGSPGYHGSISGLVKNALDYIEDLRSDDRVYLDGRAVGCVACGAGWQASGSTLTALRSIVHALRGWPTPFGAGINTAMETFDADGRYLDGSIEQQLLMIGQHVVQFSQAFSRVGNLTETGGVAA